MNCRSRRGNRSRTAQVLLGAFTFLFLYNTNPSIVKLRLQNKQQKLFSFRKNIFHMTISFYIITLTMSVIILISLIIYVFISSLRLRLNFSCLAVLAITTCHLFSLKCRNKKGINIFFYNRLLKLLPE